jgi:hypothetical protein
MIHEQSSNKSPVVFILSPGMDPTNDLIKLGDGCDMTGKVKILSLGQGQENVRNLSINFLIFKIFILSDTFFFGSMKSY